MIASAITPEPTVATVRPSRVDLGPAVCPGRRGTRVRAAWLCLVDGGSRGVSIVEPRRIDDRVVRPLGRELVLREDRVHRALGLARAAIDALVGIDEQLPVGAFLVMDAVDGTDRNARDVEDVDA